ncbi:tetratricopeptide repeat protein [Polymorphobacter fuscus]|uniref:Tetratricopeptide repeat protein n=3 Tax=Sandarakinorhabdus fusca TaxID=1439888 RepID=A0A7C9KYQ5_9SPHN|nr:tetratricopeptide repeat protein [Polymorphobacter fuscus]MQT18602.1 tetratricopeptide repeat protein [Polymorphobacter fuscus]
MCDRSWYSHAACADMTSRNTVTFHITRIATVFCKRMLMKPNVTTNFFRLGVAAAALVAAVPSHAAVSPAVGKALNQAASAAKSGNSAAAIAAVKTAQAAASSAEEKQKSAQMAGYVYTRAGRYAEAANALQASGAPARQLAPLYYQAGQYDKAISVARQAGGEDMQVLIAQAATKQGRPAEAVKAYNALIKANGPKPLYLENLAGAQYKSGDKAGYLATTEKLIRVDSSPARWKTLLINFRQNQMRPEAKLALYHLMSATNTIERPEDFSEFAKLALVSNQAGTAQAALTRSGAPTDAMSQKVAQAAAGMVAKAPAEAVKLAATPATALRGGNAYLGLGQFPQAIAAYDKAIAANGADADQARVFKGIAALKGGNANLAKQTFKSVSDKAGMKDIADLWSLYATTRGATAPAAKAA